MIISRKHDCEGTCRRLRLGRRTRHAGGAGAAPADRPARPGPGEARISEIALAGRRGTNVLLVGSDAWCEDMLLGLQPSLAHPISTWRPRAGAGWPHLDGVATLIVRDVETLGRADQRRLFEWLEAATAVKVICTASTPLLPRLERGSFLDGLYYRLNTICIRGDRPDS
jgi:hypothetical protein